MIYKSLIACVVVTFGGTLTLYACQGGPTTSRTAFAAFTSVVPALLTLGVFSVTRLNRSRWNVAMVYVIVFVLLVMLQGWLRA